MYKSLYKRFYKFLKRSPALSNREEIVEKALRFVCYNGIEGDYLEFGVYLGRTLAHTYKFCQEFSPKWKHRDLKTMRFHGFDTFEGIPELKGIDKRGTFEEGQFGVSLEAVKEKLNKKGVDFNKVNLVKGEFKDTLADYDFREKAAVVFFDCDLYESTRDALEFVTDKVVDGTVFIFGDWFYFKGNPDKGEHKAFKEWLEQNPKIKASEFHKWGWEGNSFIIHKND